ncbi:MAG: DUF4276 family protein [Propionibacteriaceae bacterium]|jgi:hypothetical protein|nr:DUF4276 family protein [Propionibacteriaceae bacterium]
MLSVAVEGSSDQSVVAQVMSACGLRVDRWLPLGGKTKLDQRLPTYVRAAREVPDSRWVVFRDTDSRCPVTLKNHLLRDVAPLDTFILRLVHTEIEAWLLADRPAIAAWLGLSVAKVPTEPESIRDAKRALLVLASTTRKRTLRDGLVRADGQAGPRYAALLADFAATLWNPDTARQSSPSLDRAMRSLDRWRS